MNATAERPIGRVVEELAQERGYSGLEELVERLNDEVAPEKPYRIRELTDWPRVGFGSDLDRVLHLTEEEVRRLVAAWTERVRAA